LIGEILAIVASGIIIGLGSLLKNGSMKFDSTDVPGTTNSTML
jgi:hypothetical protein